MTNEEAAKNLEELRGEAWDWPGKWGEALDHAIAALKEREPVLPPNWRYVKAPEGGGYLGPPGVVLPGDPIPTWPGSPIYRPGDRVVDEQGLIDEPGVTRELGADGVFRIVKP